MKVEDATKVKEKLEDVLSAVEEYGKQSEQFSKAREDLFSVFDMMQKTNSSLGNLLSDCDQYLKKASEVIDGEYFVKIQNAIDEINSTASDLEKCNENTAVESVKMIDESKKQLTALADTLSENIQSSVAKVRDTANELQVYSKQASDTANELIQSSSNEMLGLVERLKKTCDSLMAENAQLKENDAKIYDAQKKLYIGIAGVRDEIAKQIQKNTDICTDAFEKINSLEQSSLNNKNEILATVKEAINSGVSELKKHEENEMASLKSMLENYDEQRKKAARTAWIVGGVAAAVIIGLQIVLLLF